MAAALLGAAVPQAHASTQIEAGQWVNNTWVTVAQPVSILFQVGVRVNYYPMGASWSLTSPVPGQTFAPQAEIHVSQTNAQGQPIEWIVCTGTITPGWAIRNGTWSAACSVWHMVYAPPSPHSVTETVSGAFAVKNTEIQSVSVSSDTPQTLTVLQSEPFVALHGSGTLRWIASVYDGTELPANEEAVATFHLLPLVAGDQPYGSATTAPPQTYFGTYGVDDTGYPRLYHRQFQVSEALGTDQTSTDSGWTDPASVVVRTFRSTGPRHGEVGVRVTIPGPPEAPVPASRHTWLDPDCWLTGAGGALTGGPRGQRDFTAPDREFALAGTYSFAAAYEDFGLAPQYHEGANRWMRPGADGFTVPSCLTFATQLRNDPSDMNPENSRVRCVGAYDALGEVRTAPGASGSFYCVRPGVEPPPDADGVVEAGTNGMFVESLLKDQVVYYAGHGTQAAICVEAANWLTAAMILGEPSLLPPDTPDPYPEPGLIASKLVWVSSCLGYAGAGPGDEANPNCFCGALMLRGADCVVGYRAITHHDSKVTFEGGVARRTTKEGVGVDRAVGDTLDILRIQFGQTWLDGEGLSSVLVGGDTMLAPAFDV